MCASQDMDSGILMVRETCMNVCDGGHVVGEEESYSFNLSLSLSLSYVACSVGGRVF